MTSLEKRGIRNNNPLNIDWRPDVTWMGQLPHDPEIEPRFCRFSEPLYGIRAAARNLKTYRDKHKRVTIEQIVTRWAPPKENDTPAYIRFVCNQTNLHPQYKLTRAQYPAVIKAMILMENGVCPYPLDLIKKACELAGI